MDEGNESLLELKEKSDELRNKQNQNESKHPHRPQDYCLPANFANSPMRLIFLSSRVLNGLNSGICFYPDSQCVQIRQRNAAIFHAFQKVLSECVRKVGPYFDFWHLPAENHGSKLITKPLDVFRILRFAEAIGKVEESPLTLFSDCNSIFDEFYQHPAGA